MQDLPATEEVGALDQERHISLIPDVYHSALESERAVGAAATIGRTLGAPAVNITNFDRHGPAAASSRPDHPARMPDSHLSEHTEPELNPGAAASQSLTDLDLERFAASANESRHNFAHWHAGHTVRRSRRR